ncbi:MAG: thioredoxin domain-containing protein [Armatimonadota bacterium]
MHSSQIRIVLALMILSAWSVTALTAVPVPSAANGDKCDTCVATQPGELAPATQTVEQAYLGLSMGALRQARMEALPKGMLLRSGKFSVTEKEINAKIEKAEPSAREMLKKYAFVILEQTAIERLLLNEARAWAKESKRDTRKDTDKTLIQAFINSLSAKVKVTDEEAKAFYEQNKDQMGGASYAETASDLKDYLLEEKQRVTVATHIRTLSERTPVEVDTEWVKGQAPALLDTEVDKARRAGKPVLVEFSSESCPACRKMQPIIEELKKQFAEQCTVVNVNVRLEQVLSIRYDISPIPAFFIFDKTGKEIFRHEGTIAKEALLAKLAEVGVK